MRRTATVTYRSAREAPLAGRAALRVALIYIVLSAIWILFSDNALTAMTSDPSVIRRLSIIKGWGFVLATGVGLFLLVRRELRARHDVELELRRANESLSALVKASPLPIYATDRAGIVELWNPAAERIFGWTSDEVLGRPLPLIGDAEFDALRQRVLHGEKVYLENSESRHRSGRRIKLELWCAPLHDAALNVIGVMAVSQDVTEHRRAEEALRQSEARFRVLIETVPLGIAIVRDGQLGFANNALARMFGHADALEMIGRAMSDFVAAWDEIDTGEVPPEGEGTRGRHREGHEFPLHCVRQQLQMADGPATVGFLTDLTAEHEAAAALRDSEERLLQAQKMEAIGRLAGGLAHDLNNLLTAIIGFSDLMLDDLAPDSPQRPGASEILKAADRAAALTRQLLAFSRKQVLRPRSFDLNHVLQALLPMLERLIGEDVRVACRLADHLRPVLADPSQIEQVVMNLVVNARDAMPAGGTLTIETANAEDGPWVRLGVADTGVGMSPEVQAHLFEPYFTTKESGKGTGLGLSTVYGIVTQSGGQIEVRSAPGEGARFDVLLPAALEVPATGPDTEDEAGPTGGTETILVVEDERAVRHLVRDVLASHGFNVLTAESAARALEVAAKYQEPIDLLLTDVVMPGQSGLDLSRQLRQRLPGLRVLFVSGYTGEPVGEDETGPGGAGFLAKPFTPGALLTAVRQALTASVNGV